MRNKLRAFYLWLIMEYHAAMDVCENCGARGASPCSMAGLKKLCNTCCSYVCRSYDSKQTHIEDEPHYWMVNDEAWVFDEEEDVPCFDTYPATPLKFPNHAAGPTKENKFK